MGDSTDFPVFVLPKEFDVARDVAASSLGQLMSKLEEIVITILRCPVGDFHILGDVVTSSE